MLKRTLPLTAAVLAFLAAPASATKVGEAVVQLRPSGAEIKVVATTHLVAHHSDQLRLSLTLYRLQHGHWVKQDRIGVATGFPKSSFLRSLTVRSTGHDMASIKVVWHVTPSIGDVTYRFRATKSAFTKG
jgi:hypothetical protein